MTDHLNRLIQTVDEAIRQCEPGEQGILRAALTVEAVAKAMEGDLPACARRLVRALSVDIETIAFMVSDGEALAAVAAAHGRFRDSLALCLGHVEHSGG